MKIQRYACDAEMWNTSLPLPPSVSGIVEVWIVVQCRLLTTNYSYVSVIHIECVYVTLFIMVTWHLLLLSGERDPPLLLSWRSLHFSSTQTFFLFTFSWSDLRSKVRDVVCVQIVKPSEAPSSSRRYPLPPDDTLFLLTISSSSLRYPLPPYDTLFLPTIPSSSLRYALPPDHSLHNAYWRHIIQVFQNLQIHLRRESGRTKVLPDLVSLRLDADEATWGQILNDFLGILGCSCSWFPTAEKERSTTHNLYQVVCASGIKKRCITQE